MAWPLHRSATPVRVPDLPRPAQHRLAMQPSGLHWHVLIASPELPSETPSHWQSYSTLGKPQLQAKTFLLLLIQRWSSHLPSQKEAWHPSPYHLQSKRSALQGLLLKWRPERIIPERTDRPERCWLSQGRDRQAAAARSEGWRSVRLCT